MGRGRGGWGQGVVVEVRGCWGRGGEVQGVVRSRGWWGKGGRGRGQVG